MLVCLLCLGVAGCMDEACRPSSGVFARLGIGRLGMGMLGFGNAGLALLANAGVLVGNIGLGLKVGAALGDCCCGSLLKVGAGWLKGLKTGTFFCVRFCFDLGKKTGRSF
jgi:hypothetical protein